MRFDYSLSATAAGFNYEPRVSVWIQNLETGMEIPIFGVVDSGATHTVVHKRVADTLGLVSSGDVHQFSGVGGDIKAFFHTVGLRLAGEKQVHEINCAFSTVPDPLLGQDGFFDHFKVTFEKYIGEFSIVQPRIGK